MKPASYLLAISFLFIRPILGIQKKNQKNTRKKKEILYICRIRHKLHDIKFEGGLSDE